MRFLMSFINFIKDGIAFDNGHYLASKHNPPTRVEAINSTFTYKGKLTEEGLETIDGKEEWARWIDGAVRVITVSGGTRIHMQGTWSRMQKSSEKCAISFAVTAILSGCIKVMGAKRHRQSHILIPLAILCSCVAIHCFSRAIQARTECDKWNDPFPALQESRKKCDPSSDGLSHAKTMNPLEKVLTQGEMANIWFEEMDKAVKNYQYFSIAEKKVQEFALNTFASQFFSKQLFSNETITSIFGDAPILKDPKPGSNREKSRELIEKLMAQFKVQSDLNHLEKEKYNKLRENVEKNRDQSLKANEEEKQKKLAPSKEILNGITLKLDSEMARKLIPSTPKGMKASFELKTPKRLEAEKRKELWDKEVLEGKAKEEAIKVGYENKKKAVRATYTKMSRIVEKTYEERAKKIHEMAQKELDRLTTEEEAQISGDLFLRLGKIFEAYENASEDSVPAPVALPTAVDFEKALPSAPPLEEILPEAPPPFNPEAELSEEEWVKYYPELRKNVLDK